MRGRLLPILGLVFLTGTAAFVWAVEDTVPVPVHEPETTSADCCCDGWTEGCTGDCDDCEVEHSDEDKCDCSSHHEHHCAGCH